MFETGEAIGPYNIIRRLGADVRKAVAFREDLGSHAPARVAIDARPIDIEVAGHVLGQALRQARHQRATLHSSRFGNAEQGLDLRLIHAQQGGQRGGDVLSARRFDARADRTSPQDRRR